MPAGAPKQYDVNDIIEQFKTYIKKHKEPFVQEFILQYDISRSRFYELAKENTELADTIKKCLLKQELYLVKNTENGGIPPAFGIFRLKQKDFGYTDKQEVDANLSGGLDNTNVNVNMSKEEMLEYLTKK